MVREGIMSNRRISLDKINMKESVIIKGESAVYRMKLVKGQIFY